jgi:hypothetical protein
MSITEKQALFHEIHEVSETEISLIQNPDSEPEIAPALTAIGCENVEVSQSVKVYPREQPDEDYDFDFYYTVTDDEGVVLGYFQLIYSGEGETESVEVLPPAPEGDRVTLETQGSYARRFVSYEAHRAILVYSEDEGWIDAETEAETEVYYSISATVNPRLLDEDIRSYYESVEVNEQKLAELVYAGLTSYTRLLDPRLAEQGNMTPEELTDYLLENDGVIQMRLPEVDDAGLRAGMAEEIVNVDLKLGIEIIPVSDRRYMGDNMLGTWRSGSGSFTNGYRLSVTESGGLRLYALGGWDPRAGPWAFEEIEVTEREYEALTGAFLTGRLSDFWTLYRLIPHLTVDELLARDEDLVYRIFSVGNYVDLSTYYREGRYVARGESVDLVRSGYYDIISGLLNTTPEALKAEDEAEIPHIQDFHTPWFPYYSEVFPITD